MELIRPRTEGLPVTVLEDDMLEDVEERTGAIPCICYTWHGLAPLATGGEHCVHRGSREMKDGRGERG